jgi:D-3-phosphoglycerate dehydrogenase
MAERLVVALDDGYASYEQEEVLLAEADARFELRPCRANEAAAVQAVQGADVVLVRE